MSRFALLAPIALVALLTACGLGDDDEQATFSPPPINESTIVPVTPVPKPTTVPAAAGDIDQTTTLGRIDRRANETPQAIMTRELLSSRCQENVMVLETSQEAIYGALSCDGFWTPEIEAAFLAEPIAITLSVTDVRSQVLIETLSGAQAEFTVAGIWVQ